MMSRKMSFAKINELDSKQQKELGKGFKDSHICHHLLKTYLSVWFCILPLMIVKLVFSQITMGKFILFSNDFTNTNRETQILLNSPYGYQNFLQRST